MDAEAKVLRLCHVDIPWHSTGQSLQDYNGIDKVPPAVDSSPRFDVLC